MRLTIITIILFISIFFIFLPLALDSFKKSAVVPNKTEAVIRVVAKICEVAQERGTLDSDTWNDCQIIRGVK